MVVGDVGPTLTRPPVATVRLGRPVPVAGPVVPTPDDPLRLYCVSSGPVWMTLCPRPNPVREWYTPPGLLNPGYPGSPLDPHPGRVPRVGEDDGVPCSTPPD